MNFGFDYWKNKKINCLGDSITAGAGNDGYGWVEFLRENFPEAEIRKYGVSGSTVSICSKRKEKPFVERFEEMDKDFDLTIVFGGINDFINSVPLGEMGNGNLETFCGALEHIVTNLQKYNPTGQVMLITPMRVNRFKQYPCWNEKNEDNHTLLDYRNKLLEIAEYYSVPVLDFYSLAHINAECSEMRDGVLPDGLHPNKLGHQRMARKISQFIVTYM